MVDTSQQYLAYGSKHVRIDRLKKIQITNQYITSIPIS